MVSGKDDKILIKKLQKLKGYTKKGLLNIFWVRTRTEGDWINFDEEIVWDGYCGMEGWKRHAMFMLHCWVKQHFVLVLVLRR